MSSLPPPAPSDAATPFLPRLPVVEAPPPPPPPPPDPAPTSSFVIRPDAEPAPQAAPKETIAFGGWRWVLLGAYAVWIVSHVLAAFTYLRVRGLIGEQASADRIDHEILRSAVIGFAGFSAVYLAQWAWVLVAVHNSTRVTVNAPPIVMAWLFAVAPIGTLCAAAVAHGAARTDLLIGALLLSVITFFGSFSFARKALESVRGDLLSIRSWSLAVSMCLAIQYVANVLRPPTQQQVLLLGVACAVGKALALLVAVRAAARVTSELDASMHTFRRLPRVA